jgi:hypothetical protein
MLPPREEDDEEEHEPIAFSQIANQSTDVFASHLRDRRPRALSANGTAETDADVAVAAATQALRQQRHGKLVNDAIHGLFRLDPDACAIVDTPEFQRLRDLKQLGLSHMVYPCASHSRFEHSLGTYVLADRWATHFQRCQPELGVTHRECKLVALAGLCHDLGHGPFSHLWDNEVLPRLRACGRIDAAREWSHEQMSCDLLEHLYDENGLEDKLAVDTRDGLVRSDLRAICELISIDKKDYDANGCYTGTRAPRGRRQRRGRGGGKGRRGSRTSTTRVRERKCCS